MNKVQVLQMVADKIDLNLFYSITVWKEGQVNMQGDLTADALKQILILTDKWNAHDNGWIQCSVEVSQDVKCDITLIPVDILD